MEAQHRRPRNQLLRVLYVIVFAGFIGWTLRVLVTWWGGMAAWPSGVLAVVVAFLVVGLTYPWWRFHAHK